MTESERFLAKARESLASAEADYKAGRYNSSASRAYYAAFQAAVAALINAGIRPDNNTWRHRFVMNQVSGRLVRRRKLLPATTGRVLPDLFDHRTTADYDVNDVSRRSSSDALRKAERLVNSISDAAGSTQTGEAKVSYGSEDMSKSSTAAKALARERIKEIEERLLSAYPDCHFEEIEFGPKDYRLIIRTDAADLMDVQDVVGDRRSDILVDDDIWIVLLVEPKKEVAA